MNTRGEFADIQSGTNISIFPITLQMGDIINPSTVKTSYSKTITLPHTDTNDRIFSHYFKLDKLVSTESFNALEKTPFIILINGTEHLFEGWIRLIKITKEGYEVNLFSNEGKLFNSLAEKKLNELDIDLTHKIGRNTLWNGWNSDDGQYEYLKYAPSYKGLYDNFTSNKTLNSAGSGVTELDNDIDEYNKFELRSYYQHPAIKLSKLIETICIENNIEIATEDFFTSNNPYWGKLFMINPKMFNIDKPTSLFKPTYRSDQAGQGQIITNSSGTLTTNTVGRAHSTTIYDDFDMESSYRLDLTKYPAGTLQIEWEFDIEVEAIVQKEIVKEGDVSYIGLTFRKSTDDWPDIPSGLLVIKSFISGQNNAYSENEMLWHLYSPYDQRNFNILKVPATYTGAYDKIRFGIVGTDAYPGTLPTHPEYNELGTTYRVKGKSIINNDGTDQYISFTLNGKNPISGQYTTPAFRNARYYTDVTDPCYFKNMNLRFKVIENENLRITVKPYMDQIRSNYKLTKDNLLDNSITQSEFLLNYMKLFGLVCYYDKSISKYILCTRNKFYENAITEDWTYKVNPDEINLEPNNIDARKYTFKYQDLNTTHYNRYKDVFGTEYGSVYIDTNNQHLDNTEEFFTSTFSCPLMEQSYNYDQYNVQYRLPWKALGWCSYDGAKRSASIPDKPTLMFWNGLNQQSLTLANTKPWLIISDDNYLMRAQNEYYWSNYPQNGDTINSVLKCSIGDLPLFPEFTSLLPYTAALDFAVPKVTFFETEPNALTDDICLYNRFYEGYVNDKLSIHNKIIEIPVNLNNNDILNFKFNKFYAIKETPFVVIEIKDYNPMSVGPTIVKMQRVIDLDNYKNGQTILINDIRTIDGSFNIITQSGEQPTETELYCEYYVPNSSLITEVGFEINGVMIEDTSSSYPDILMTIDRPYQSDYINVRAYIVYDELTYFSDLQKIGFIPYVTTFSGFTKTIVGDDYDISLDYVTNAVVVQQGFIINGVEYVDTEITSPITKDGIVINEYNIVGWIKTNDDTYTYSNNYFIN